MVKKRELLAIIESQDYRCALTGWELEPQDAHVDHIVAYAEGGACEANNLQVVHELVNRAKGTMSNDEFVRMCVAVAGYCCQKPKGL